MKNFLFPSFYDKIGRVENSSADAVGEGRTRCYGELDCCFFGSCTADFFYAGWLWVPQKGKV